MVFPPFLYRGHSFRPDSTKFIDIFLQVVFSIVQSTDTAVFPLFSLCLWEDESKTSASCSNSNCRKQKASPTPCHNTDRRKHWMQSWQTSLFESEASFKEQLYVWGDLWHLIQAWSLHVLSAGGKEQDMSNALPSMLAHLQEVWTKNWENKQSVTQKIWNNTIFTRFGERIVLSVKWGKWKELQAEALLAAELKKRHYIACSQAWWCPKSSGEILWCTWGRENLAGRIAECNILRNEVL